VHGISRITVSCGPHWTKSARFVRFSAIGAWNASRNDNEGRSGSLRTAQEPIGSFLSVFSRSVRGIRRITAKKANSVPCGPHWTKSARFVRFSAFGAWNASRNDKEGRDGSLRTAQELIGSFLSVSSRSVHGIRRSVAAGYVTRVGRFLWRIFAFGGPFCSDALRSTACSADKICPSAAFRATWCPTRLRPLRRVSGIGSYVSAGSLPLCSQPP
jgi:hypothetical protein